MGATLDPKFELFKSRFHFGRREYSICSGVAALFPGAQRRPREVVIPRACGGSSTPRLLGSIAGVSGILDRPPSRAMTTEDVARKCVRSIQFSDSSHTVVTPSHSRGALRPRFAINFPPFSDKGRRECRAPDAPAVSCAMVVVEAHTSIQVTPESPGTPRAMVYGL